MLSGSANERSANISCFEQAQDSWSAPLLHVTPAGSFREEEEMEQMRRGHNGGEGWGGGGGGPLSSVY